MRIFLTRWFSRFARKEDIADDDLREAIARALRGLVDADLGGGLIKQRIARRGEGRSGGYRVMVAYCANDRAVFLYGFAKNERDNIDSSDLADLREAARVFLGMSRAEIAKVIADGRLKEVQFG